MRSHKTASVLNVVGLAIAFTAFYVIASQVWYSVTYNSPVKDAERTYLISPNWNYAEDGDQAWSENSPQPTTRDAVNASPDAEAYTWFRSFAWPDHVWSNSDSGDFTRYDFGCYVMGTDGVEMFGFKAVDGELARMREPDTVIISATAAESLGCKVGDQIWINAENPFEKPDQKHVRTIVGIYEDFPRNTFLYNHHIFSDDRCEWGQDDSSWNYSAFVRLKEGSDPTDFAEIWEKRYSSWYLGMVEEWERSFGNADYKEGDELCPVKLVALDQMYYFSGFSNSYYETGSRTSTLTLTAIALLIVILAFINFFNFYMALVPSRLRSVNINKVLGASRGSLRQRVVSEAMSFTLMAFCLATLLISALKNTFVAGYVTCSLAIADNVGLIMVIGIMMIMIAAVSSLFPAIYSTSINTSMAVKTGFAHSRSGRALRSVLVGLQFTISMMLIIVTAVFHSQYRHMLGYDLGFDKDNVLTFSCRELGSRHDAAIGALKAHPEISSATAASSDIFSTFHNIWGRKVNGRDVLIEAFAVRWDFPETMGINFIDGEGFSDKEDMQIAFTPETMGAVKEICSDGKFDDYAVKGTIRDIRLTPVNREDVLVGLYTHPLIQMSTFYVRPTPGADMDAVRKHIRQTVSTLAPDASEPEICFVDDRLKTAYSDTLRQTTIIGLFAFIAVLISLMGVFSIVMFETRHREAEISIRKVYGATVEEIIRMFNRRYIMIVAVCFLIAAPAAYVITSRWLEQFPHRISVPLWVFPASLALVLAVTVTLVTLRSMRSARTNPSEALKKE